MNTMTITNPEKTMKDLFELTDLMNEAIHQGMTFQGAFHKSAVEFINNIYDKVQEAATVH
jgi:hypothetical protein